MKQNLSIIFPIYNEQNRIEKSFLDIEKFIETNTIFDLEIIFVNDGSIDETDYKIKDFIKKKTVIYISICILRTIWARGMP